MFLRPVPSAMSDLLSYFVSANLAHGYSGASFTDRAFAIAEAQRYRDAGWTVSIAIHGEVEGFELWRALSDQQETFGNPAPVGR